MKFISHFTKNSYGSGCGVLKKFCTVNILFSLLKLKCLNACAHRPNTVVCARLSLEMNHRGNKRGQISTVTSTSRHQNFDEKFEQGPESVRIKMADLAGR